LHVQYRAVGRAFLTELPIAGRVTIAGHLVFLGYACEFVSSLILAQAANWSATNIPNRILHTVQMLSEPSKWIAQ
jgi:hypothetical protein